MKNRFLISLFLMSGALYGDHSAIIAVNMEQKVDAGISDHSASSNVGNLPAPVENLSGFAAGLVGSWALKCAAQTIAQAAGIDGSLHMNIAAMILPAVMGHYIKQLCFEKIAFLKKQSVLPFMNAGSFFSGLVPQPSELFI